MACLFGIIIETQSRMICFRKHLHKCLLRRVMGFCQIRELPRLRPVYAQVIIEIPHYSLVCVEISNHMH
jgi:hypothetical protein